MKKIVVLSLFFSQVVMAKAVDSNQFNSLIQEQIQSQKATHSSLAEEIQLPEMQAAESALIGADVVLVSGEPDLERVPEARKTIVFTEPDEQLKKAPMAIDQNQLLRLGEEFSEAQ